MDNPGIRKAIEVQGRHTKRLMDIPGVVGHGVGISKGGEPVIKIFTERAGIPGIPIRVEGVPTKVKVTGKVVAYIDPASHFERPVPIGVSTGHPDITAGTIGCRVTDGNDVYALSNNHVYANENEAFLGDRVLQPGPYDGGQDPRDTIGTLVDFEPIDFSGGDNEMDAAIAHSSVGELGTSTPGTPGADGYGTPGSTVENAYPGMGVQKFGRTTAWTHGTVDTISTSVDVCYQTRGPFRCVNLARFVDQIAIVPGNFSDGGDSGSLIVTDNLNRNPVGLLFAGSSTHTFANPIGPVLTRFGVTIDSGGPVADLTDIAVTEVNAPGSVIKGDSVNVYVTVQNTGNQNRDSSFNVILTDSSSNVEIGSQIVSSLAAGISATLTFIWDTSGASSGDHTLVGSHDLADDVIANDTADTVVSINEAGSITLTATERQNKRWLMTDLAWNGANSENVLIYRDGAFIATTGNDGFFTDKIANGDIRTFSYKVCEEGTSNCSNEATVTF
jgi:hypothetical protein